MNENYNDMKIENEIDNIIEATTQRLNCESINNDNDNTDTNIAESNNLEIDSQNIEVFNIALHQYLKIDEEIKVLLEAIKLRNKTKKNLAETLGTYLRANEINNVKLGGTYKGKKF